MAHSEGLNSCLEQEMKVGVGWGLEINCLIEEHFLVG